MYCFVYIFLFNISFNFVKEVRGYVGSDPHSIGFVIHSLRLLLRFPEGGRNTSQNEIV